ncbi:LytR/AlgR family response regulator transcription factor [Hymenobacter nivis]|uniref:DNA-binding response regulator n=1 Tax=Hymenobacter nivis TaxID=1850093 RepID=A0A502GVN1_9BACT|nr:response regulator transcription factor [Hymenobacter nivis]TPG66447.1 DNA-binding response regulator [Hymenobacter nivis]
MAPAQRLTCVIIDDEPLAQELLQKYLGRLGFVALLATFDNAVEALARVEALRPDLVLLDVNMPEMNGLEFLNTFTRWRPAVIFTTAYSEYAVQGFEYDAVDFLLKPITFERFARAIGKARQQLAPAGAPEPPPGPPAERQRMLLIKENKKFLRVSVDDVLFVEGMKDYLKIYTKAEVVVAHMTMTKMAELLDAADFLRVNRSYLVQKAAIKAIHGNTIEIVNGMEVPVGINYRETIRQMTDKGVL